MNNSSKQISFLWFKQKIFRQVYIKMAPELKSLFKRSVNQNNKTKKIEIELCLDVFYYFLHLFKFIFSDQIWIHVPYFSLCGKWCFLTLFVLLSTECRVMKGAKAQRGSVKSPGPIRRIKSPAESSEPIIISPTL